MRRIAWITALSLPLFLVLLFVALYGFDQVSHRGRVARNVSAAGVDLSNLSEAEAAAAVRAYEANLVETPAEFVLGAQTVVLDPGDIDLTVDEQAIVDAAMQRGRTDSLVEDFTEWLRSWREPLEIRVPVAVDEEAIDDVLQEWDESAIDDPAFDGSVVIEEGVAVGRLPKAGSRIYRQASIPIVHAAVSTPDRSPASLPLFDIVPALTTSDVDEATHHANELIGSAVTLRFDGDGNEVLRVPRVELAAALSSEIIINSRPDLEVWLDEVILLNSVQPRLPRFDTNPVEATFELAPLEEGAEERNVKINPSSAGLTVDRDALPEVITAAALGDGTAELPLRVRLQPDITTEEAEAMEFSKVSQFTTYHPCCANRVVNIQTLADEIDGAIVLPGETFSVNEHAGQRTLAEGYRRAGAIINGEVQCCDSPINIGGGTSQFATTFYNAVFFGCYEDIEHQPHSLYFSRYPWGREATLGYPKPDVIFRNDTQTPVIIDTSHTGGSITVAFYGNTDGRECTAESSSSGLRVRTVRVIEHEDGTIIREPFTWTYRPKPPPKPKPEETSST